MNDDIADVASECSRYTGPYFIGFYREDGSAQFFLYVEGVVLTTSHSFSEMLMAWFSSFFVLNLEYMVEVLEVCLFFQESVFNLPTGSYKKAKSGSFLSITTDIRKFVS